MSRTRKTLRSATIRLSNLANLWVRRAQGAANVLEINLSGQVAEDISMSGLIQRFIPTGITTLSSLLSAIRFAEESPLPAPEETLDDVYV